MNPLTDQILRDPLDDSSLRPEDVDPGGRIPDPTPVQEEPERVGRRPYGYFLIDGDEPVLATDPHDATLVWRHYHGHASDVWPQSITTEVPPGDLITPGDVKES